jgi:hypothetical protein
MLDYVACKALTAFIEAEYSGLNVDISALHSQEKHMVVFVEQTVMDDTLLINNPGFSFVKEKLMTFRDGKDDLTDKIDFIICLGGDGTLLYASLLFQVINILLGNCCGVYLLLVTEEHMSLCMFLHSLPNVLVQIANKMGLQKKVLFVRKFDICVGFNVALMEKL